jgi:hypothetical protein
MIANLKNVIFGLLVCLVVISCSSRSNYSEHKLPSGRVIKVIGIMKMSFSQGEPALMLRYYTDISITTNASELQKEVQEIWEEFRSDVETSKLSTAIISANEMPHGIISQTHGFNFTFKKQSNGEWILIKGEE